MPSLRAGCHTCKARRIKCDNIKPICQRCTKSRRVCLQTGAKKPGFSIHIENCYASGDVKRPRGPRSTLTSAAASSGGVSATLQRPIFDLQTQALLYYLHFYLRILTDTPSIVRNVSDYVPAWISKANCSMVDLAVSSMALAVYSRTQRHPPAGIDASVKYQQLLRIARATIPNLDENNIDACLLTVFLMGRYEDAIHRPHRLDSNITLTKSFQSPSHHDGAMAILRVWKTCLSCRHPATDIIKHSRRGVIRSALIRNLALPGWIMKGNLFGENGLELDYDRITVLITDVRHQLSTLLRQEASIRKARAQELSKEAGDINKMLEDWKAQILSDSCYQRHTYPNSHPRRHFYSSIIYSYSSPMNAVLWIHYFSTKMLLDSTRLRILGLEGQDLSEFAQNQQLESCVKVMADNLASSIPFALERFKVIETPNSSCQDLITLATTDEVKPHLADLILWPLALASSLQGVDSKQKVWARAELVYIGRILGGGVLECAETDQWLEL